MQSYSIGATFNIAIGTLYYLWQCGVTDSPVNKIASPSVSQAQLKGPRVGPPTASKPKAMSPPPAAAPPPPLMPEPSGGVPPPPPPPAGGHG